MKKHYSYLTLAIILIIGCLFTACSYTTNDLYVSQYKGLFTSPPQNVPTPHTPDGPIAGNGDVGLVYAGTPDQQYFYFSKNDFWKAKRGYPEGGVCLPGGLTITVDALKGASYYAEQTIDKGTITAIFKKGALTWKLKSWVPATENLVVIELSTEGAPCNVNLDLWVNEGNESRVESGVKEGVYWFSRHFDTPELDWPTHLTAAMKIEGADNTSFVLEPSSSVRVVVGFCTNHDQEDYFEAAIQKVKTVSATSLKQLRIAHEQWWADFWSASRVEIGDTLIEKHYYGSQYLLASCSRNKNFPPGLWGISLTRDATLNGAWEGDYHTNYNHQAPWWGSYSSNHVSLSDPYDTPVLEYMENAKKHANDFLDCRGVYYPVGIGPRGFCSSMYPLTAEKMKYHYRIEETGIEGGYMFLGQKSNAVFCTANMFMRFYHTYDQAYAEKVYPFIREVANFWEDYLTFENGRYVSYDDSFWEVGPWMGKEWKKDYGDFNPTVTLGMLRMLFKGIHEMSSFLKTDLDRQEKWQHILDHLSPVPTVEVNGGIRIKACEGGTGSGSRTLPGFGRVMMHGLTFPTGVTGVKTDPVFAGILRKEIDRWGKEPMGDANWDNLSNGFETTFTSAARLGYNPDTLLFRLKERVLMTLLPNLWVPQRGGGIETLSAIPSCINEMLLQGYEGIIRVFPTWPANKDAKFENLRTYGAFLVSSKKINGMVNYVELLSEKGRPCTFENPWGNTEVKLERNGKKAEKLSGEVIKFNTEENEHIMIKPSESNSHTDQS